MSQVQNAAPPNESAGLGGDAGHLDPALVQQVAELVYAMLLRDLRIDRERRGAGRRMSIEHSRR
jgi:hypothetical protein